MAITAHNSFRGRQYRGEVIILCRALLPALSAFLPAHLRTPGGTRMEVDSSCIWRWVRAYARMVKISEPTEHVRHAMMVFPMKVLQVARLLAHVNGSINQQLLLQNEYLAA